MRKPFSYIRELMMKYEIDQITLAEILGRCIAYVSQRMTAKKPWDLDDMYKIMDTFSIPYSQMHIYFPKNGKRCEVQEKKFFKDMVV